MTKPTIKECEKMAFEAKNTVRVAPRVLVYLAGPYTHPDSVRNTKNAIKKADELMAAHPQWLVVVPHLSLLWDLLSPKSHQFWYAYTLEIMLRCDMVYRMVGESEGADMEVEVAQRNNIPVVYEEKR